ncbi:F-box/LRR-repeat protein 6-like isoform X2 [Tachypleus tridentatus]|uniref:F-box/LRR-repeat protein 6-like isoform X2 n=1 Tax=Tachypleus tridentatus TaxID=6853 RepID=UPI003FD546F5
MSKKKLQKGILGMKQDPNKPILFSFAGEMWPSDDSDDSDFSVNSPSHDLREHSLADKSSSSDTLDLDIQTLQRKDDRQSSRSLPSNNDTKCTRSKKEMDINEDTLAASKSSSVEVMSNPEYSCEEFNNSSNISGDVHNGTPVLNEPTSRSFKKMENKKHKPEQNRSNIPNKKQKKYKNKKKSECLERAAKISEQKNHKRNKEQCKEVMQVNKTVLFKPKSRTEKLETDSQCPSDVTEGPWGKYIPEEILVYILKIITHRDGVFPLLPRVSRVCKLWNRAAQDLSLWEYVDLSWGRICRSEDQLIQISNQWLKRTCNLNLTGWGTSLTSRGVLAIAKSCSLLTSISLAQCTRVTRECVQLLVDHCPNLASIDLSGVSKRYSSQHSPLSPASLKYLVSQCGKKLTRLILAENEVAATSSVLNAISESCPRLEELDISNLKVLGGSLVLFLEKLQHGCPNLRILRVTNSPLSLSSVSLAKQAQSPGFQELEELSIALDSDYQSGLNDIGLERITKKSHKLKLLDVRGCRNISVSGLIRVPAWNIQYLYLAQSAAARMSNLELVLQKWSHSLEIVDLSWANNDEAINRSIEALITAESGCPIRTLDLSGSAVSYSAINPVEVCHEE